MNSLYIGHLNRSYDLQKIYPKAPLWRTCMRSIVFFDESQSGEIANRAEAQKITLNQLKGAQAYRYLLEVICGLKSDVIGETEVLGQFKIFLTTLEKEHPTFYSNHRTLFQSLLQDCKELRQKHIQNWGGSSYGSLTRKMLEHTPHVSMLGNGQLAQSLLPWMKEKSLVVYARTPRQATEQLLNSSLISNYGQPSHLRSLVVAARVENSFLQELVSQVAFHQVIDWRTEISLEMHQLPTTVNYYSFKHLIASMENEKIKKQKHVDMLSEIILQKVDDWRSRVLPSI